MPPPPPIRVHRPGWHPLFHLLHVAPSTIRHILDRASLHRLAQQLARSHNQQRILYEPGCSILRSSALDARQTSIAANLLSRDSGPVTASAPLATTPPSSASSAATSKVSLTPSTTDYGPARTAVSSPPAPSPTARPPSFTKPAPLTYPADVPSSLPLVSASTPSDWPAPAGHFFNVLQLAATGGTLHDVPHRRMGPPR